MPEFVKSLSSYQKGELRQALTESFLQFDAKLLDLEVKKVLENLAECVENEENQEEETELLKSEAEVPVEELVKDKNLPVAQSTSLLRYLVSDELDDDDDDEEDESYHE